MTGAQLRPTRVEVDLGAIEANAGFLRRVVAPAALCAVVKADGYGHGVIESATAALRGGASTLAVALADEGMALRNAGVDAPILVLAEPTAAEIGRALESRLTPTVCSVAGVAAARRWAEGSGGVAAVHVKVNTGMNRMGAQPDEVVALLREIDADELLRVDGVWTHLACADAPESGVTAAQLAVFERCRSEWSSAGIRPVTVHAANSAGALIVPDARYDMVRCGIALYGVSPGPQVDITSLRPAMSVTTRVSATRRVSAGEGVSYGHVAVTSEPTTVATLPIGYADGLARRAGTSGVEVVIRGRRLPLIGVVTMDQCMVDCGDEPVEVGDSVVLIGRQGAEQITADELATRLGTIGYEVVCAFGPRIPREYHGR